jgi:hypothetical protein
MKNPSYRFHRKTLPLEGLHSRTPTDIHRFFDAERPRTLQPKDLPAPQANQRMYSPTAERIAATIGIETDVLVSSRRFDPAHVELSIRD